MYTYLIKNLNNEICILIVIENGLLLWKIAWTREVCVRMKSNICQFFEKKERNCLLNFDFITARYDNINMALCITNIL